MRQCNGCQECCNGNLLVNILGQEVYKGNPCKFLCSSGCGLFKDKNRPEICKSFNCVWKMDEAVPEEFYPKDSGIIIMYRNFDGYSFILIEEFWGKLSEEQQEKILKWLKKRQKNAIILKEKETVYINYGNKEEMEYLTSRKFGFE